MSINTIILNQQLNSSSQNNTIQLTLPSPFFATDIEIALMNAYFYYSWFNVTTKFANKTFSYKWIDGITYNITLPDGFYTISDLNGYLQFVMSSNGHYLVNAAGEKVYYIALDTNTVYYAVTLTCTVVPSSLPSGWTNPASVNLALYGGFCPQLIIGGSNFGSLIGFASGTFPTVPAASTYQVNSTLTPQISPVVAVNITCNMANNSTFNTAAANVIYTMSPNVGFAEQIQLEPRQLLWFECNNGNYNVINVSFLDQNYDPLALNDRNLIVTLAIRKKQK